MARQNRGQATRAAQQQARVNQLDSLGSSPQDFIEEGGMNAIELACADFIQRVQDNADGETDMITTGDISNITLQAEDGNINILGSEHLLYQDRGVNGAVRQLYNTPHKYTDKKPPVQPIIDWIKQKGLVNRNNQQYSRRPAPFQNLTEEEEIKRMAYAIREKIYQEGFKPRNIYSKELPKLIDDCEQGIRNFVAQNIVQVINVKPEAKRIIL